MSTSTRMPSCSSLFKEPLWLGFKHDGYPITSIAEYQTIRDTPPSSGRNQVAILQSWLTFGLLEAVIRKPVSERDLIKQTESGKYVMSKDKLPGIIEDWVDRLIRGTTSKEDLESWSVSVNNTLKQVHSMMVSLLRNHAFTYPSAEGDDIPATICFIGSIGEILTNAKMSFPTSIKQQGFSWRIVWTYSDVYQREMVANGWCPFTVQHLVTTSALSCLEYASMKKPSGDKVHDDCSKKCCAANMVDVDNYTPKHASLCSCENSTPPLDVVLELLSRSEVPIIMLADVLSESSPVTITVQSSSTVPYVAISHVWADGLGSTTDKGLPTCQVKRLATLSSKIVPGGGFWIDSLCVPSFGKVRKQAINLMAQTYRDASAVVVIDQDIQLCTSIAPLEEKLLRVLVSGWMQRLWTLQEAVLAKKLLIKFADTLVPLRDLIPSGHEIRSSPLKTELAAEIFRLCKRSEYNSFSIGDIARSLRWRATSRAGDETLAIASLLNIETSILSDTPPEERMITLLSRLGKVPSNVLFLAGPKLDVPGFHWAPLSFMTAHGGSEGGLQLSSTFVDAVCTPQGLVSIYHALIFPPSTLSSHQEWKIADVKKNRNYMIHDPYAKQQEHHFKCNILLFNEIIPFGGASACVAVLQTSQPDRPDDDGEFRVTCQYQKRLVIVDVPASGNFRGEAVTARVSGRLKVLVT